MTDRSADIEAVEIASQAFAEATDYYTPFHRGLSSESSNKIRKGIRAAIEALRPFHAAAEAKARIEAYEDAAGVAMEFVSASGNLEGDEYGRSIAAAILQRWGEKGNG